MDDQDQAIQAEELETWTAWKQNQDASARQKLIDQYLWLPRAIALKVFRDWQLGSDLDPRDLVQFGTVGLLESINRFDPTRGVDFVSFAKKRIRGAVQNGIDSGTELRAQLAMRRQRQRERLASLADNVEGNDRIGRLIDLTLGVAIGILLEDTAMFSDDQRERQTPYHSSEIGVLRDQYRRVVNGLPPRYRDVVQHHYFDDLSFTQIGELLGLTTARISQIHSAALKLIRERMLSAGTVDDWL